MAKEITNRLKRLEKIVNINREDVFLVFLFEGEYDIFNAVTMKDIGSMSEKAFSNWLIEVEQSGATVIVDDIL
ncbi:hypothetical protein [Carnobacterium mobile]|uniref:hypothetical protein n=1 Tax=Carnobacterium mobile TaxID=2750 RepID=UPI00054E8D4D|nr:hypothetical protein [Carnobacterium mobile]